MDEIIDNAALSLLLNHTPGRFRTTQKRTKGIYFH